MDHPHATIPEPKQTGGVVAITYEPIARIYGSIDISKSCNLLHYPTLNEYENKIDGLVDACGYDVYIAGGKYGKPDLKHRNFNTGYLMIYDPTPESGGGFNDLEYTRAWRKIHELAHALTYKEINKIYGEGRRLGKLGIRTLREAKRAVHWEWLTVHMQQELLSYICIFISDKMFNKELNTVMHDAVHRAIYGKFTEPGEMGYHPSENKINLSTALELLDMAA